MAVFSGGIAGADPGRRRAVLSDRSARSCELAPAGREAVADFRDGGGMAEERRRVEAEPPVSVWRSMIDRRVLALAAIHFAQAGVSVSMAVFIALMIKGLGLTNMQTGWLTSV